MLRNTAAFNGYLAATGGSGPAKAIMASPSTLGYRVSQTPSFSIKIGSDGFNSMGYSNQPSYGNIDVSGIGNLTGANSINSVTSVTFRNEWAEGLDPGAGNYVMAFIQEANFNQTGKTGFWSLNSFTQFRDGLFAITGRQESDYGINRAAETLSGQYETYNNRWLTFISAESNTSATFAGWNPLYGDPSDTTFARTCVWDTETQTLLQTLDISFTPSVEFIDYLAYESLGNISTNGSASDSIRTNITATNQYSLQPVRFYNFWSSFGQTFDPANPPDTSIFTTRPSSQIGDAEAWINAQMVQYETNSPYDDVLYTLAEGDDRYSQSNNRVYQKYVGNATIAADSVSTTIIPKDRNI